MTASRDHEPNDRPARPAGPARAAGLDRPRRGPVASLVRALRSPAVTGMLRSWQGWLILAVIASQLLLPLHYYTVRRDRHDERFAWRMFSPMRMTDCAVRATVDGAPFALEREFHEAWLAIARRGRFAVVEEMGARLCEKHGRKPVVFHLDCKYVGQPPETYGGFDMCNVPLI